VRDAVLQVDDHYLHSMVDWIDAQPDKASLGMNIRSHQGPDLFLTTLSKIPIDAMDLGFGKPLSVGPGRFHVPVDGFALLVNYQSNGGGTFAFVSLLAEPMEKLLKHEPLMKFVG
jgi:shikimate O-hydroxycinnamoyltransferase